MNGMTEKQEQNRRVNNGKDFCTGQNDKDPFAMQEFYPLTQTQSGILVESLSHPDTTIYNVPFLYRLSGKLDLARLKKAVEEAVAAHPYLNATLAADAEGNFRVRRNDGAEPQVELIETGKLPEDLVKPFDLLKDRLYRLQILKTDEGSYLFMDFHHIL